jgi:hypothetical protein
VSDNGHRGRPYGLYAAVVITLLAGLVIASQMVIASRHEPARPEPAGTIQPLPLWSPTAEPHSAESHGEPSGTRIYLSIPNPAG